MAPALHVGHGDGGTALIHSKAILRRVAEQPAGGRTPDVNSE
jgi:hypothetical protein